MVWAHLENWEKKKRSNETILELAQSIERTVWIACCDLATGALDRPAQERFLAAFPDKEARVKIKIQHPENIHMEDDNTAK